MVIRRPDAQGWACDFRSPVPVTLAWHMGRCGGEQENPGSSVVTSIAYWWATDSERLCFKRRWRERAENMQWWHLAYVHTHAHAHTHTCYPYIFSFLKTNKQNKMHAISSLVRQVWVRTTVSYCFILIKDNFKTWHYQTQGEREIGGEERKWPKQQQERQRCIMGGSTNLCTHWNGIELNRNMYKTSKTISLPLRFWYSAGIT